MNQIACKGSWEIESEQLVNADNTFVCTLREKCYHYSLSRIPMIGFYDIVPISMNKDGLLDTCSEYIPTPFEKEEKFRKGDPFKKPPGIV